MKKMLFTFLCFISLSTLQKINAAQANPKQEVGLKRPDSVQAAIDMKFEAIRNKKWPHNGTRDKYDLLGIDDDRLILNVAHKYHNQTVNIVDLGCAEGQWGRHAQSVILADNECQNSGNQFHIYNITGGTECQKSTTTQCNVTIHQLNNVEIENINEELIKRYININGKVDLIVSNKLLQHLVDPIGTLIRMYNLLTPNSGIIISNEFYLHFNNRTLPLNQDEEIWSILSPVNVYPAQEIHVSSQDECQFAIQHRGHPLTLPIKYTGETTKMSDEVYAVIKKQDKN